MGMILHLPPSSSAITLLKLLNLKNRFSSLIDIHAAARYSIECTLIF
jgi:hypothetical protein